MSLSQIQSFKCHCDILFSLSGGLVVDEAVSLRIYLMENNSACV